MIFILTWLIGIPIVYTILILDMKSKPQAEQFSQEQTLVHALSWPILIGAFNYKLNRGVEWVWTKLKELQH